MISSAVFLILQTLADFSLYQWNAESEDILALTDQPRVILATLEQYIQPRGNMD